MPNWCESKLTVKGLRQDVSTFLTSHVIGDAFDFNTIIPEPATEADCPDKYHIPDEKVAKAKGLGWDENDDRRWFDWYSFHIDKWGTKWNACNSSIHLEFSRDKGELTIWFDTAWSPAILIIEALMVLYPNLEINLAFIEEGMAFAGCVGTDGTYDVDCDYSSQEFRDFCKEYGFYDENYFAELDKENSEGGN